MTDAIALARGRAAYARGAWRAAFATLSAADRRGSLAPEDLQLLGTAAYLLGRDTLCEEIMARAHLSWQATGRVENAARCAFWVCFSMFNRGELGPGSGWLGRARRLLDDHQLDCAEQGYLLVPVGLQGIDSGDAANAYATFDQIVKIAERFRDPDLLAMARFGTGVALLRLGEAEPGMAQFDETMVSVSVGEVSPIVTGIVYCGIIQECLGAFDVRRAREWTAALSRWCEAQPDLVPFRGQCLVHRSQLLQLRGDWPQAMEEARRARGRLETPPGQPALGMALYQLAELHRLRGEYGEATAAYREAGNLGHEPQPGLALVLLAQGQGEAAQHALRICLDHTPDRLARTRLLHGYADISLAVRDLTAARAAADELAGIASGPDMPALSAMSTYTTGSVLLAEDEFTSALAVLWRSCEKWREVEAPYEVARARELTGRAHRALGAEASAQVEFDAAREVYLRLGAATDAARLSASDPSATRTPPERLTSREGQVLALVAAGKSNRDIASCLVISEHTVARHLQNIFAKLNLSSRTAAVAYAFEHGLVGSVSGQNEPRPGAQTTW